MRTMTQISPTVAAPLVLRFMQRLPSKDSSRIDSVEIRGVERPGIAPALYARTLPPATRRPPPSPLAPARNTPTGPTRVRDGERNPLSRRRIGRAHERARDLSSAFSRVSSTETRVKPTRRPVVVGLLGGIASGKSSVAAILGELV